MKHPLLLDNGFWSGVDKVHHVGKETQYANGKAHYKSYEKARPKA